MIQRLLGFGIRRLFSGARQGRPLVTGFGAALALFGWWRKYRGPDKDLLYDVDLEDGESVRISFARGDAVIDETDVGA